VWSTNVVYQISARNYGRVPSQAVGLYQGTEIALDQFVDHVIAMK
jgi:hypothetical protein